MQNFQSTESLPRWLWLWVPLFWLPVQFAVRAIDPSGATHSLIFDGEMGAVEQLTAILLIPAAVMGLIVARRLTALDNWPPAVLLVLFAFGCIFLMLEEISYGQHFFKWASPDYFLTANMQYETNLHNLEYVDKNIPKWILVIAMAIGGIILPLLARRGPLPWPCRARWIAPLIPTGACLPSAALTLVSHVVVKLIESKSDFNFYDVTGVDVREVTELYISLFFLLYALGMMQAVPKPVRDAGE